MTPNHTESPIRLVTFDLYDTLLEMHPRRWERLAAACRAVGITPDLDALKAADLIVEDFYTEENGGVPIRDRTPEEREAFRLRYTAIWLEAAGLPHDAETTRAVRRAHVAEMEAAATRANYHVYDDVIPALRRLRDSGVKRALISNADADVTALCTRLEFAHDLNLIVTSAVVGWEKPDVRTFRAALDPLGVEPHETIHIGDQPKSDVVGALAAGMCAALIDRYARHDPAAHDVPVVHGLMDLVDLVLAHNEAARRRGGKAARRQGGEADRRVDGACHRGGSPMTFESLPLSPSRLAASPPAPPPVRLLSVNVATPAFLGTHQGAPVESGIRKRPVEGETVWLAAHNLDGDRQADQVNHGGSDKAVYAYPSEHLPRWTEELGANPPFGPGSFGENLTVGGWFEDQVRIGDIWAWGDARLQVAQPRYPCYKLGLATGYPGIVKRLVANGRTGWYLRILEPGRVPLTGEITVVERHPAGVTVLLAHRARLGDCSREDLEAAAACAALPGPFRAHLMERLASLTPPTPAAR